METMVSDGDCDGHTMPAIRTHQIWIPIVMIPANGPWPSGMINLQLECSTKYFVGESAHLCHFFPEAPLAVMDKVRHGSK